ncbi:mite allergen Eur m 3-like [Hetaerina americana]|uniref:mite allergen Eur m 3-like n=1 Tax=Hetaerina americana TaxID=62018 RepID=UPI003A7F590C
MSNSTSLVLLLFVGTILGSPPKRAQGIGAAKNLHGIPDPYIVGGVVVEGREFPGQISLQVNHLHSCGGSILNENYLLTAAHCSEHEPSELNVLSGTNNLKSGGMNHTVTEIHIHEDYDPFDSWHNDIAVIKVDPPFEFDADGNTAPVNLPAKDQETPKGSNATVIGWGRLTYMGEMPDDLYKVSILIWDHGMCNDAYKPDGKTVYPEQICADTPGGNMGSCNGDAGGPLFVNNEVVGLVSWTKGCGKKGFPTVHTRVSSYRDWIDSKIKS